MRKVVLWDFHGTLARRSWSETILEVLDAHHPGHAATRPDLLRALRGGYPWHAWERPHPELSTPGAWWRRLEAVLADAIASVGVPAAMAPDLARRTHHRYVDPAGYEVFPDARPALESLRGAGWRHAILSNHTPELPAVVEGIGLGSYFDEVITSAAIGYEKPHPEAFRIALDRAGRPETVWFVGDNPRADGWGARRAGVPAVLVRGATHDGCPSATDLLGAAEILVDAHPE